MTSSLCNQPLKQARIHACMHGCLPACLPACRPACLLALSWRLCLFCRYADTLPMYVRSRERTNERTNELKKCVSVRSIIHPADDISMSTDRAKMSCTNPVRLKPVPHLHTQRHDEAIHPNVFFVHEQTNERTNQPTDRPNQPTNQPIRPLCSVSHVPVCSLARCVAYMYVFVFVSRTCWLTHTQVRTVRHWVCHTVGDGPVRRYGHRAARVAVLLAFGSGCRRRVKPLSPLVQRHGTSKRHVLKTGANAWQPVRAVSVCGLVCVLSVLSVCVRACVRVCAVCACVRVCVHNHHTKYRHQTHRTVTPKQRIGTKLAWEHRPRLSLIHI